MPSSWTRSWVIDPAVYVRTNESISQMLKKFDKYTEGRYHNEIKIKLNIYKFENLLTNEI